MQTAQGIQPVTMVEPLELVSDQLLNEVYGEILLIRTVHTTTICKRTAPNLKSLVLTWLYRVGTGKARFFAGKLSKKGGLFHVVSRHQAIELLGRWIFEEVVDS